MNEPLASFRELKGIGPATEARLHETGIYTWEALATVASALASVRGNGDTPRDIANAVAARRDEAGGGETAPRPPGAERVEAFVLRMSLTTDGEPQRCQITHVRSMAEQPWAGWRPTELADFVQKHAGIRPAPAPPRETSRAPARLEEPPRAKPPRETAPAAEPSQQQQLVPLQAGSSGHYVVVLDAGKAIGGANRDINLRVTNTRSAGGEFGYRATLAARKLGPDQNGGGWTGLASQTGTASAEKDVVLAFAGVQLPPGIQRLQLRLEVNLSAPTKGPPALTLG